MTDFRTKLLLTLRDFQPVLREEVLVCGSEVPNLLQQQQGIVIVSQDVDIAVPVEHHKAVRAKLREVSGFRAMLEEPSVWLPDDELREERIEVNFVGMDTDLEDPTDTYVLEDSELPLLVFGNLSLLTSAGRFDVEGVEVPLPEVTGLALEKLMTERSGVKGDRDLLVALALLQAPGGFPIDELVRKVAKLSLEQRHAVRANLIVLSLMQGQPDMPDPELARHTVRDLIVRVEDTLS